GCWRGVRRLAFGSSRGFGSEKRTGLTAQPPARTWLTPDAIKPSAVEVDATAAMLDVLTVAARIIEGCGQAYRLRKRRARNLLETPGRCGIIELICRLKKACVRPPARPTRATSSNSPSSWRSAAACC